MKKTIAVIMTMLIVLFSVSVFATGNGQEIVYDIDETTMQTTQVTAQPVEQETQAVQTTVKTENKTTRTDSQQADSENIETKEAVKKIAGNTEAEFGSVSKIVKMNEKEKRSLKDYQEAYESDSYGFTAYVLNRIQVFSVPFCFLGIAISAIYQYVLGIRKLDTRDKGFAIMISIVTLFVIAQVLPLIFAIVVKGWRG